MSDVIHIIRPAIQTLLLEDLDPNLAHLQKSVIVSDASESSAYVFECDSLSLIQEYPFSLSEQQQSSSMRELLAVHRVFVSMPDFIESKRGSQLVWVTDSQVMCYFLNKGSRVRNIQRIILDITSYV